MFNEKVEGSPSPSSDAELCQLLHAVRRGDVIHPRLKQLLVHLGFVELRGLQLILTGKGRHLMRT
ncbi:hypothetical protein [Pseudomonas sp. GCEP-101]|mgnify:CR=1 FL=1|uniref:hypothetical protein n=1 Tax=Pseudomonas sp. GCEP-101 TaxID=2974552 RepID=UPI00223A99FC|nr:hypothetical protein [Pseudomonas sp. GCEP-101]